MNKKLIAPIVTAAAMLATSIGSTFALFTSKDETNIAITAGKLNIFAKMENPFLYSADYEYRPESGGDPEECLVPGGSELGSHSGTYYYKSGSTFANGGTGEVVGGDLKLNFMSPGDKAVSKIIINKGETNIDFKYRIVCELVEEDDDSLRFFSNLELTALGETRTHVRKFATNWTYWNNEETEISSPVKVVLPITVGNEVQVSHCTIRFTVEAVQGNAYTVDDIDDLFVQFNDKKVEPAPAEEPTPSGLKDLDLEAWKDETLIESEDATIKVHVPAGSGDVKALVETAPGVQEKQDLQLDDTLTLKVEEKEYEGTYTIEENDEVLNYEISLYNQDHQKIITVEEGQPLDVYINIGILSNIKEVLHSGEELVMNDDDTLEVGEYEYNESTGIVHILTNTFSPFSVIYQKLYACFVNEVPYLYIEEALEALKNETKATVIINKEVYIDGNDGYIVGKNQDITIDLNGWSVIGRFNEARGGNVFRNNGKLTIKDSSIEQNGKITDTGLTIDEAGNWHVDPKRNYADNVISNYGTLTLESGTIEQGINGNIVYCVDNYSGATFNMTGGHLYNYNAAAVRMFCSSTSADNIVNITGGHIEGFQDVWVQNASGTNKSDAQPPKTIGHLNISGGTFDVLGSGTDVIYSYEAYYATTGDKSGTYYDCSQIVVNVSGGIFNAKFNIYKCSADSSRNVVLLVSGGSFIAKTQKTSNNSYITLEGGYYYYEPTKNKWAYYYFGDDTYEAGWYWYSGDFIADCAEAGYLVSADEEYMYVTPMKVEGTVPEALVSLIDGYLVVTVS